ncbi:hypothetical protein D3C81_325200 [compost metagenome]
MAHGPPVVLLGNPVRLAAQVHGSAWLRQIMFDHAAEHAGNAQCLFKVRAGIGDSQLHGGETPRRPDRPPAVKPLAQRAGAPQQGQVTLVSLPVTQALRQAHVRPFPARHLAIAHVARGLAFPERRGATEQQQQRQPGQQLVDQLNAVVPGRHANVHMQATQQAAPGHLLVVSEQLAKVLIVGRLLVAPAAHGVTAGGQQADAFLGQYLHQLRSTSGQKFPGLGQAAEHWRRHLDLALEHLLGEVRAEHLAAQVDLRRRGRGEHAPAGQIDQQVFFLDAKAAGAVHRRVTLKATAAMRSTCW